MGLARETLGFSVANPSSTYTAVTMASGDQKTVRQFTAQSKTVLTGITRQGATAGAIRVRSAVMHDPVYGLTYITAENPTHLEMPPEIGEPMQPGDSLIIEGTGGSAETEVGTIDIYYQDVLGLSARLMNWADVMGAIEHLHTVEVDCTPNGSAGTWADTLVNATQDTWKADRKYAILGYQTDTNLAAVAFKGAETGNVRCGGPGTTDSKVTNDWFVYISDRVKMPCIPIFSANNKGSFFASIIGTPTSGTVKLTVTTALLAASFQ